MTTVSSAPMIAGSSASRAAVAKRTMPPSSSWSVIASAARPSSFARATSGSGSAAPSSREKAVWAWSSAYLMRGARVRECAGARRHDLMRGARVVRARMRGFPAVRSTEYEVLGTRYAQLGARYHRSTTPLRCASRVVPRTRYPVPCTTYCWKSPGTRVHHSMRHASGWNANANQPTIQPTNSRRREAPRSIHPPLQPPRIIGAVQIHHELPRQALAPPVVAPVTVLPPIARESLRPDRPRHRDPMPAPRDHARHLALALHLHRLRRLERTMRGGGRRQRRGLAHHLQHARAVRQRRAC